MTPGGVTHPKSLETALTKNGQTRHNSGPTVMSPFCHQECDIVEYQLRSMSARLISSSAC